MTVKTLLILVALGIPLACFTLLVLLAWWDERSERRRIAGLPQVDGACPTCGYDLFLDRGEQACPGCGARLNVTRVIARCPFCEEALREYGQTTCGRCGTVLWVGERMRLE